MGIEERRGLKGLEGKIIVGPVWTLGRRRKANGARVGEESRHADGFYDARVEEKKEEVEEGRRHGFCSPGRAGGNEALARPPALEFSNTQNAQVNPSH
ncbi:hypothetical protein ACLOJK_001858 [Asimina triloba]